MLTVEDREVPDPGPGEIRVQVAATGVNFIEVYQRQGVYPVPTPFVLGAEGAGVVDEAGADAGFAPGDRVAWTQGPGSGAGYVLLPADKAVAVPDGVELEVAAASMLQGLTAHYLVNSTYPVAAGDTVLVHAVAGGVGQLLVQLAKAKGATVIGTAGTDEKAELGRGLGADHVINYSTVDDLAAAVRELTDDRGVDVAYDGIGKSTFDASLASIRPRGMMVLFGAASGPVPPFDIQRLNQAGSLFLTRPTLASYVAEREEFVQRTDELFGDIAAGRLKVSIGGRYPLAEAARAYDDLEGRRSTGKLLLLP